MAKATVSEKTRVVIEKKVTLELTDDEARTLAVVLAHIGGSQGEGDKDSISPRVHTQSICNALVGAGYSYRDTEEQTLATGCILFDDYPAGSRS